MEHVLYVGGEKNHKAIGHYKSTLAGIQKKLSQQLKHMQAYQNVGQET